MKSEYRRIAHLLDSETVARILDHAERRVADMDEWLHDRRSLLDEQRHLNEGSAERAYWHYGYRMALRDLLDGLRGTGPLHVKYPSGEKP